MPILPGSLFPFLFPNGDTMRCDIRSVSIRNLICPGNLLSLCSLWVLCGCTYEPDNQQPGRAISITVLSGGQRVTAGQVDLSGHGGGSSLNDQGMAIFNHVPYGKDQVMILPPEQSPVPAEPGQTVPPAVATTSIPRQFLSEKTTPLTIDVNAEGERDFTVDLQAPN